MIQVNEIKRMSHMLDERVEHADDVSSVGQRMRVMLERIDGERRAAVAFGNRVERAVNKGIDLDVFGATYTPYPKGKDGRPILLGQKVYGEDGREWTVLRIIIGKRHCVVGKSGVDTKEMLPEWLTHERPETVRTIVGELAEDVWNAFCRGTTWSDSGLDEVLDEYAKRLRVRQAEVLRRYSESDGRPTSVIEDGTYVGSRWVDMDEKVQA